MARETFNLEVSQNDKGLRLDVYLAGQLSKKFSRSFIQRLITAGSVLVNGSAVKSHHKVNPGESIAVVVPEPIKSVIKGEDIPLDVIYEDEDLLVVNKPQGLVVHPAPGNYNGTLVNALLEHCKKLSGHGGEMKPGIVHRIDKGTSGLLVAAKTVRSHMALAGQFKARTIKRVYIAFVKGIVELDNGIIELPIGRSPRNRKKMAVNFVRSKTAVTRYHVLRRFKDYTMLEITLGTGRTHQIRVHMSYIGHPLLGDEKYGSRGPIKRPALHAKTLGFIHPVTKKYMEFTTELPDDMQELMQLRP